MQSVLKQLTTNNPYTLPDDIFIRIVYLIKGYDRMKAEYQAILDSSPPTISETQVTIYDKKQVNPTEAKAIKLSKLSDEIYVIEQAQQAIPVMYRKGVFENIVYGTQYPIPDRRRRSEWDKNKAKYIYTVAEILHLV